MLENTNNKFIQINGIVYPKDRIVEVTDIKNAEDGSVDPYWFLVKLNDRTLITISNSVEESAQKTREAIVQSLGVDKIPL